MGCHIPGHDVAVGQQRGAAMMIDHAFGVAGGAGGVVQCNRLPLVLRPDAGILRVALGQQGLVGDIPETLGHGNEGVVQRHHERLRRAERQGLAGEVNQARIDQEDLGLAVFQDEGHGCGIQAGVDGIEHCARQRHAEVGLEQGRRIGGHGIVAPDAPRPQGRAQAPAAL